MIILFWIIGIILGLMFLQLIINTLAEMFEAFCVWIDKLTTPRKGK